MHTSEGQPPKQPPERRPLLEFNAVDTYYGELHVLKGVNYRVGEGEIVCLLGGNASGKSTTMKTIFGIVTPARGTVTYAGEVINTLPTAERVKRHRKYVTKKVTVTEATLNFEIVDEEGDAFLTAIKNAAMNDTRVALYALDVAKASGGEGLDADWYITEFSRDENNTEFVSYKVTAVLTDEDREPAWG